MSSEEQYRAKLFDYRGRMCRDTSIDDLTYDAYCWWMNEQLREMEQEMKKKRPARRSSLRTRLKDLLSSSLTQTPAGVKEAQKCLRT
jgi:hypothetical protein